MAITETGLSGSSVEYYARINAEKAKIKNQAAELENAAQNVKDKLRVFAPTGLFAYLYDSNKNSSVFRDFSVNALRELVKNYNELNKISAASEGLSDEGRGLLDKVKALLGGPAAGTFREIGLQLDAATGHLIFDDRRFADKLAAEPSDVRQLLLGNNRLGPVMQRVIDNMLARPTQTYFNSSFIINA